MDLSGRDSNSTYLVGTNSSPRTVFRPLPGGTLNVNSRCAWYLRDQSETACGVDETYSTGYGVRPLARTNQYVYDANNGINLVRIAGPYGETLADLYDANHNLLRATNAVGDVACWTYNAQGRLSPAARQRRG